MKKILLLFAVLSLSAMTPVTMVSAADEKKEIVFADVGGDSLELNKKSSATPGQRFQALRQSPMKP